MTVIDIPFPAQRSGWFRRVAGTLRPALSALLRPRPDLRELSPYMLRDVGLIDSTPVEKQP